MLDLGAIWMAQHEQKLSESKQMAFGIKWNRQHVTVIFARHAFFQRAQQCWSQWVRPILPNLLIDESL